jgi:hypothetical protein
MMAAEEERKKNSIDALSRLPPPLLSLSLSLNPDLHLSKQKK